VVSYRPFLEIRLAPHIAEFAGEFLYTRQIDDMHCGASPERQHMQDMEQLHAHTVNRMSLSIGQP